MSKFLKSAYQISFNTRKQINAVTVEILQRQRYDLSH
jgi:hypothetical protein